MTNNFDIANFLLLLFPLMLGICLHEAAHAWTAYKFGDNTAYAQGRVTLNPISHIDPIGTIIVPIAFWILSHNSFTFGWARPVPFNPRNLKNYRHDASWIAAAGPLSNFLMAFLWAALFFIINKMGSIGSNEPSRFIHGLLLMSIIGIQINLLLAIFNLIPIPPLDGGHIAQNLLPARLSIQMEKIKPYGMFILLALIYSGVFPIGKIVGYLMNAILHIIL